MLRTAEDKFSHLAMDAGIPPDRLAELPIHRFMPPEHAHRVGQPPVTMSTLPVEAFVNHGRWMVECGLPGCGGAQHASRQDRRFFCVTCLNAGCGGGWRPVVWPVNTDAIETALSARDHEDHQNWRPGETLAHLHAENTSHGVPG